MAEPAGGEQPLTKRVAGLRNRQAREELRELYKGAVEEYRFQVQLNWSRSQYLLAFNAAILTVGTGLLKLGFPRGDLFTAGVFAVGALASIAAVFVTASQHGYYRMARDRAQRIETKLGLGDLALDTTSTMRGTRRPWFGKVTNVLYLLFAFLAALNLAGTIYTLGRTGSTEPPAVGPPSSPHTVDPSRQPTASPSTSVTLRTPAGSTAPTSR